MTSIASLRSRVARCEPRWILLAGWLIVIAYAFPGYMNWDSGEQLIQARAHWLVDWHPPIMGAYWRLIEIVVSGPFGMLVLQTAAFEYGIHALLCLRFRPRTSALLAAAFVVFPPVLTPMAVVWKDAQTAGFLVAGLALALGRGRWRIALGCALLTLAAAVRDNGAAALPPLCLLIAASWQLRRTAFTWGAAVALFLACATTAALANACVTAHHAYPWYKTVAIHDFAGTICFEDPMSDDEVRAALRDVPLLVRSDLQSRLCRRYDPRAWFALSAPDRAIFDERPDKSDRLARRAAWWRLVRDHPHAYLTHRWAVMKEVLGLSRSQPWEPVCQSSAGSPDQLARLHHDHSLSWFQQRAGRWFGAWSETLLYRPWAYALVALILLGHAARRRDRLLAALLGSGLLYEASYFLGAAAPDYRYSHWLVVCCSLSVAIVFGERFRAGRGAMASAIERDRGDAHRSDASAGART